MQYRRLLSNSLYGTLHMMLFDSRIMLRWSFCLTVASALAYLFIGGAVTSTKDHQEVFDLNRIDLYISGNY